MIRIIALLLCVLVHVSGFTLPASNGYCQAGDFMLAMLHGTRYCTRRLEEPDFLRQTVPRFVLDKLARLPGTIFSRANVSLGIAFLETCYTEPRGAAVAGRVRAAWSRPELLQQADRRCGYQNGIDAESVFLVHGVVGGWSSAVTQAMLFTLQNEALPTVGTECSSDSLSDRARFPNFVRLVSPDSYQATVIIDLMRELNWTYVGLVYDPGSVYNTNIALQLSSSLPVRYPQACLAFIIPLTSSTEQSEVLDALDDQPNLRALVWLKDIDGQPESTRLLQAVGRTGVILMMTDGSYNKNIYTNSTFTVYFKLFPTPDLLQWYLNLTYADLLPMYNGALMFDQLMNCSLCACCNASSVRRRLSESSGLTPASIVAPVARMLDAFLAFAHAIDAVAKSECSASLEPELNKTALLQCVTGERLLRQLYRLNFTGYTGHVRLDASGNGPASYVVLYQSSQQVSSSVTVGVWTSERGLSLNHSLISWPQQQQQQQSQAGNATSRGQTPQVPESVCSLPCASHEYRVQVSKCCWVCRPCNSDEIVGSNGTQCEKCASLSWPSWNSSVCEPLGLTVLRPSDTSGIVFISVAALGSAATLATGAFFLARSHAPLLKASSLELSVFQQAGILLGLADVALFFGEPSLAVCNVQAFLYHLSLTMVYAALLTKSARIYRVFVGSMRGASGLKFTGRRAVVAMTAALCLLQVALLSCVLSVRPIRPVNQPLAAPRSDARPVVEFQCDYFSSSQWIPYALNLLLMLVTCSLAVRIRSLPDNFHDSKCILAFTACATFVWIAFIPSLVTLSSLASAAALLVFVLLFTNLFALCILFLPKVYAVAFDKTDNAKHYNASVIDASGS